MSSRNHFDMILRQLTLSVSERRDLESAWQIQQYGEESFLQKQYIEHFFENLPVIEQAFSRQQNLTGKLSPVSTRFTGANRSVIGSTAVEEELFSALCSLKENTQVTMMVQPDSVFINHVLFNPSVYRSGIKLMLISRLSRNRKDLHRNLPILEQIMRIFSVFPDCVPLCYYSESDDSREGIIPQNIVLTDHAAFLIAGDGEYAFITSETALLEQLNRRLQAVCEYCITIGRTFSAQVEEMSYLMQLFQRIDFTSRFELSGSFCTTPFLTADIIQRNVNPVHPQREELTAYFTQMLAYLRKVKEEKPGMILSSIQAMTTFARTGVLQDVPRYLIPEPLLMEDRLTVLSAIRQGIADGWYHLRLFREENVILDRRWDSVCMPTMLFIELFCADGNRYFEFTENTLLNMFTQYLQNLIESEKVTSEKETLSLIEQEIEWLRTELQVTDKA